MYRGRLGPKPPKSLKKEFPGLPARSVKKSVEKVPNDPKRSQKDISVRGLFQHLFDTPGGEAWEVLFETFGDFEDRGCGDSCVWGLQS